jgi:hypothetical protein
VTDLGLHVLDEFPRDVRSKMSCVHSEGKPLAEGKYVRRTSIFQCLCGTDHEIGRFPAKKRQIGWEYVECSMFARVVSTHDESDPQSMVRVFSALRWLT